jgi:peptide chain release factor 1
MELSKETKLRLRGKLDAFAARFQELGRLLADPQVMADRARLAATAQEHGALAKFAERQAELRRLEERRAEAEQSLREEPQDEELAQLAREEIAECEQKEERLMQDVVVLLLSDEMEAGRNVIVEIRAGTGGEEAALFAGDLCRMYTHYAEKRGWKVEAMDASPTDLGGMKEIVLGISGRGAWQKLRYESGGHRVQRVPQTESQGRIHTSLATVAVLPEAEDVDLEVKPEDIEMSFMRSRGPGGQKVNKTSSAVRLVHKPTGITVRCQDEKSQQANRKKAMKVLRAKLYEMQERERHQQRDALRRSQVGSGDRNERVRTYNFPQDRITDHRIGLDVFGISSFLMGDCDRMFDALAEHDRQERVRAFAEALSSPTEPR